MGLPRRLGRHLSVANVLAAIALFVALGGAAYAAHRINGRIIVNRSIAGGKLKNGTITARQIKPGSLGSGVIDESSLTNVSSAQTAQTANSARTAGTATSAQTATNAANATNAQAAVTAQNATNAQNAAHATDADHAANADHATTAGTAEVAKRAEEADRATTATTAGDAETVGGFSPGDLALSCQSAAATETELFGGMCWDKAERKEDTWFGAIDECAKAGGRLPSIGELIAYVDQTGEQVKAQNFSGDLDSAPGGVETEKVFTSSETERKSEAVGGLFKAPYRCVFYRVNRAS